MQPKDIKAQFTKHIKNSMKSQNPKLGLWYAGITNSTKRRKAEHLNKKGDIEYWKCIDAETLNKANEVEAYFSEKGTRNAPSKNGAKNTSKYVYIFKLPTQKSTGLNGPGITIENILKTITA